MVSKDKIMSTVVSFLNIKLDDGEGYVRECYSIGAVSGILTMQGIYRNAERGTRPGLSKRDG